MQTHNRNPRWQRLVCDWSMIYDDETVFVRGEEDGMMMMRSRRFRDDETVIFDSNSPAGGGLSNETIAEEIGRRIVDRDEGNGNGNGNGMCVVCQDQLMPNGRRRRRIARLDCGHQFHPRCIQKWLCRKNNCPLCKATALRLPSSNLQI